ncbi:MAG: Bug family tripartite tricarboxylate transporter substrate binding protein [Hyphomicrobiales bacterium]
MSRDRLFRAVLLVLCISSVRTAAAETPAQFYEGKTLTVVVGVAAGGGYDAYARFLAPHLEAVTGATVVVVNQPGASGILALNRLMGQAPDGLTLMFANGSTSALAQFLRQEGVRYDLSKMAWIAGVISERRVLIVPAGQDFTTLLGRSKDGTTLRWGGTGLASGQTLAAALLSEAIGLKARIVLGFKGSRQTVAALLGGELDAVILSSSSAWKFARSEELHAVATLAGSRSPLLPDVPAVLEHKELPASAHSWIELIAGFTTVGRAYVAPPGIDAARVAFLRAAFERILTDPVIKADAQTIGRPLHHTPGEEMAGRVARMLRNMTPERADQIRNAILSRIH